jgi:hypothetical protein
MNVSALKWTMEKVGEGLYENHKSGILGAIVRDRVFYVSDCSSYKSDPKEVTKK